MTQNSNCETRAENIFENLIFSGTRYGALRRCGDPVVEKTMIIHRPCQSLAKKHNDEPRTAWLIYEITVIVNLYDIALFIYPDLESMHVLTVEDISKHLLSYSQSCHVI